MWRRLLVAAGVGFLTTCAFAQDNFGEFVGNPRGTFIAGPDRPLFKLDEPFVYKDPNEFEWTTPAGEVVDGASIPPFAWSFVGGPFSGNYLNAAIIHDYYCCAKSREYYSTHHAFWLGMLAAGVDPTMADIMWTAVRFAGPEFWSVDPSASAPSPCKKEAVVASSVFDMSNDRTKAIAIGKFAGMARTLKTTGGRLLDIVDGKQIKPRSPEADEHLDFLRSAMTKNFDVDQDRLGLTSVVTEAELKSYVGWSVPISPWVQGQIPDLDSYMKIENLKYPEAQLVEGNQYTPYVVKDVFKLEISDFPSELSTKDYK